LLALRLAQEQLWRGLLLQPTMHQPAFVVLVMVALAMVRY